MMHKESLPQSQHTLAGDNHSSMHFTTIFDCRNIQSELLGSQLVKFFEKQKSSWKDNKIPEHTVYLMMAVYCRINTFKNQNKFVKKHEIFGDVNNGLFLKVKGRKGGTLKRTWKKQVEEEDMEEAG